jgi:hypothetical protein
MLCCCCCCASVLACRCRGCCACRDTALVTDGIGEKLGQFVRPTGVSADVATTTHSVCGFACYLSHAAEQCHAVARLYRHRVLPRLEADLGAHRLCASHRRVCRPAAGSLAHSLLLNFHGTVLPVGMRVHLKRYNESAAPVPGTPLLLHA